MAKRTASKTKTRKKASTRKQGQRGPDRKPRKKRSDKPKPPPNPAGRPKGSTNDLPLGAVGAIRSLRWRVPDQIPEPLRELADEALDTVATIMRDEPIEAPDGTLFERSAKNNQVRLTAARIVREEICGPVPKTVEHQGGITLNIRTGIERNPTDPPLPYDPKIDGEPAPAAKGKGK